MAALEYDNGRASQALAQIARLYKVESEAGLTAEQRAEKRKAEAYPVLVRFEKWLEDNIGQVIPRSPIGNAISYTYSLMDRLSRYVNDGRLEPDNNLVENAMRPLAIGRKNWLFCSNEDSATRAAIVYTDSLLQDSRHRPLTMDGGCSQKTAVLQARQQRPLQSAPGKLEKETPKAKLTQIAPIRAKLHLIGANCIESGLIWPILTKSAKS